jgi:signal transduction histidine kinase
VPKAELLIEEELLIRVLVNLIDNAIKFSHPK